MQKNKLRQIGVAIGIFIAFLVVVFLIRHYRAIHKPHRYSTAIVTRADIENSVLAMGVLQAYKQVDVGSRASGQLKSLNVELGDTVQKGQLLAEIDPIQLKNKLRSAQIEKEILVAEKKEKNAQLRYASAHYQRQKRLLQQKSTSLQHFEEAQSNWLALKAHLDSLNARSKKAQADVDIAKTELDYTRIIAPMAGEVVAIVTQEGQTVIAQQQAPVILKLANLETMTVKVQVPEADVIRIQAGQTAYFTILGEADKRFYGKLQAIESAPQDFLDTNGKENSAHNNTPVFYNALFDIPNPHRQLRIGMTAETHIVQSSAKAVLTIPVTALGMQDPNGYYAVQVVLPNHRVETRKVRIAMHDTIKAHVLSGLKEGEHVITDGSSFSESHEKA